MAGIEQLEVHSKSYIVRWVKVDEHDTLSWSVQPHKKSINFGIVKHPGSGATALSSTAVDELNANAQQITEARGGRLPKKESTAQDVLASKGFIPITWCGKCEADKVSIGTHDVPKGQGGMYALVFDNTFSKQTSKTATFVVLTYPTGAAPQTVNHLPNLQLPHARGSETSLGRHGGARLEGQASASVDSLGSHRAGGKPISVSGRSDAANAASSHCHMGNLSKRRRKKGQGYARRYFSLDYSTCTLSYYYNRNSSALRGAIPLSLAAIAADERRREISIDSGAEVWHLRAPNDRDFQEWARALERASRVARGLEAVQKPSRRSKSALGVDTRTSRAPAQGSLEEDAEWEQVETLVSRVVGTRDALRRLTEDVAALSKPSAPSTGGSPTVEDAESYFLHAPEKKPFWKRKASTPSLTPSSALGQATSSALAVPSPGSASLPMSPTPQMIKATKRRSKGVTGEEKSLRDHCQSLLTDLDSVVGEFSTLISSSKRRRMPAPRSAGAASRGSIDSVSTSEEFFDAEDAASGVAKIDGSEDETPDADGEDTSSHDGSSISSMDDDDRVGTHDLGHLYPAKPKNLSPLPIDQVVQRRTTIPQATVLPPSLISFVRKNVGKDLSTISMPVSANEPISLLQRVAEQLEYSQLLDEAAKQKTSTDRLLHVTAFAISQFSNGRTRERAIRKPFNPLLGETFELVRSDKEVPGGFRLLVEKVSHRPVKLAMQADSSNWSFSQTAAPGQKFWGKSAEITTDGRVRVALRLPNGEDEFFSWTIATMFLRNVVMGEKYVEPVGSMYVSNDSTNEKATVEFRSKGMFGGRAEEVHAEVIGVDGKRAGGAISGTWTQALKAGHHHIWQVGKLVDNAPQSYGMTLFAATLNEITALEKDKLPPTDSRLRPDQRLAEQGMLDEAEVTKHKLEEAQRARRRDTEQAGESHRPKWFTRAEDAPDGEEVWKLKSGKDSYWEERTKGSWAGVGQIFET